MPDANALIYLAKADLVEEALCPSTIHVGDTVHREAVERGMEEGHADAYLLDRFIDEEAKRVPVGAGRSVDELADELGGAGEAEAFLLARQASEEATVITSDELAYRRITTRGVDVVRTDTLLYHRHQNGNLDRHSFYEGLLSLRQANGTSDQRIAFFLTNLEEPE